MGILEVLANALDDDDGDDDFGKAKPGLSPAQLATFAKSALAVIGKVGMPKLVELFTKAGLKEQVLSWISTGADRKVSGAQVSSALGPKLIGEIAKKAGIDPGVAAGALARYLPKAVDLLTPDGQADDERAKRTIGGLDLGGLDLGGVDLSDGIGLDDVGGLLGGLVGGKRKG